jgi:ADP-ribose pyrophosphatase YjhB (NUDIX family)
MWEFPGVAVRASESFRAAARRAARAALTMRLRRESRFLAAVPHAFSHRRETYHVWLFETKTAGDIVSFGVAGSAQTARGTGPDRERRRSARWVLLDSLENLALPAAQRWIARLIAPDE